MVFGGVGVPIQFGAQCSGPCLLRGFWQAISGLWVPAALSRRLADGQDHRGARGLAVHAGRDCWSAGLLVFCAGPDGPEGAAGDGNRAAHPERPAEDLVVAVVPAAPITR